MLTHWSGHFPTMDLMDPDALAGNGSNAIWRDWRGPLTDRQVAALWTPFYHPPHHAGENLRCKKTIQVDGLTLPGSLADPDPQEKVISLSEFIGMLLQHFFLTFGACDEEGLRDSCGD